MKTPSISVILPTYNRANVLGRAIESVLDQTYSDFELIVVDSGSDKAKEIVRSFDDDRISYFWQEPRGLGAARNFGMEKAQSNVFAFQDDDDEWHRRKLAKQMEVFEDAASEVGVVYTGVWKIKGDDKNYVPGEDVDPKEGNVQEALLPHNFISPQTAIVKEECFEAVGGFDENLPALEDWELWLRISQDFQFRYIDEPLVTAYIDTDSMSLDFESLANARDRIVRKHYNMFDDETRSRHLFWSGHGMMKTGKTRQGQKNLFKSVKTNFEPFYLVCFLISLFGSTVYKNAYKVTRVSKNILTP